MKVEYDENFTTFDNIAVGKCFKFSMSFYMKIDKAYDKDGKTLNAVGLSTGGLFNFDYNSNVLPVKLKAVRADD